MRQRSGTIDVTADGKFRLRVTGDQGRKTVGIFESREEAESVRRAAVKILESDQNGTTLAEYGEKVLTEREINRVVRSPETYWSKWRCHIASHPIASMPLKQIRAADIQAWVDETRRRVSAITTRATLAIIRTICKRAVRDGKIKVNPVTGIEVAKQKLTSEPWTFLTPAEQEKLLAAAPPRARPVIAFAIGTGLRAGELVALREEDIKEDRIIVRFGGPNRPTKSGKIREVPILPIARDALHEWQKFRPKKNEFGLAFQGMQGGYRPPHVIAHKVWKRILRKANLGRRVRWHDLRHTCASSLISGWWGRRWSTEEVRALLGHASVQQTERYAHLAGCALQRAASETTGGLNWAGNGHEKSRNQGKPSAETTSEVDLRDRQQAESLPILSVPKGQLRPIEFLTAVSEGRGEDALRIANEIAGAILDAEVVKLATEVRKGGPLAIVRAMRLAEALIGTNQISAELSG